MSISNTKLFVISILLATLACMESKPLEADAPLTGQDKQASTSPLPARQDKLPSPTPAAQLCARVTAPESLHIRYRPEYESHIVGWLYSGQIVEVLKQQGTWWLVYLGHPRYGQERMTGWSRAEYLALATCM